MHERQGSNLACLPDDDGAAYYHGNPPTPTEVDKPTIPTTRESLKSPYSPWQIGTQRVLDSYAFTGFMLILTVYALFGDDVRSALFSAQADDGFYSGSVTCLFFFTVEILAASWAKPQYRWSFYFYLDVISTLSLIPDIGWIWSHIVNTSNSGTGSQVNQVQSAGVTSRAATRTTRIIRVIRLIRLVRLAKLYKSANQALNQRNEQNRIAPDDEYSIPEESKIGKKLTELTIKRVIVLVLVLLILLPLFELTFFLSSYTSWDYGVGELQKALNRPSFLRDRDMFLEYHKNDIRPILFLSLQFQGTIVTWSSGVDLNFLRLEEKYYAVNGDIVAVFDLRYDQKLNAMLNICQTLFVCIVLTLGALYLTKDANVLVIQPIEKMIDKVKRIAQNPISAMNDKMQDVYDLELQSEKKSWWVRCFKRKHKPIKELETAVLEDAIMKIGALLALGFGEAGAHIIAENLSKDTYLNAIVDGTKVMAIFAFCDIRNFTDTTEVLQERVMVFVNEIAAIVHHTVDEFVGAANKNIGDAFLLVWKFPSEHVTQRDSKLYLNETPYIHSWADLSLLAMLKIVAKINSSTSILKYRENSELVKRMPNYSVKLGFGLHMGWAIEGAIGSEFKIDASYLSPNVNLTCQLEELTKVYGVPIIMSNSLTEILSHFMRVRCRHIDTVLFPSSHKPVRMYTYDVSFTRLIPVIQKPFDKDHSKVKRREKMWMLLQGKLDISTMFYKSKRLKLITDRLLPGYVDTFERGVDAYEAGDWQMSKAIMEQSLEIKPTDGPSLALLNIMKEFEYHVPAEWPGYRVLSGH